MRPVNVHEIFQIKDLPKNEIAFFKEAIKRPEFKEGYSIVYCKKCKRDSIVSTVPLELKK